MASDTSTSKFRISSPLLSNNQPAQVASPFRIASPPVAKATATKKADGECADGSWGTPAAPVVRSVPKVLEGVDKDKSGGGSICMSLFSIILTIPALIGAWCWPAIVFPLFSIVMNDAARAMGHYIQLGLTFVIFLGMSIWIYLKREKMSSAFPFWTKWGPFILMLGASFLVVFDPLRHVLQDFEWWPAPGSSEYRRKCHDEVFACLSPLGIWVTLVFTYSGFILMIWATMWQAQIGKKLKQIRSQWRDLRGTQSNTV